MDARRGRHRHDQLHERHHGPAQGRAADPPQPLAQRHHLRLARRGVATATCTCTRCRCSTATAGACRTRITGMGGTRSCCARSTAPRSCAASTQHGVTLLCGAPAVVAAILDAAAELGRADPRRGPHPHGGGRGAAADPHDRAGRDRAGLGVHPDLRAHRDRAAAHHEPEPGRVRRPRRRASGPSGWAGPGRRRSGVQHAGRRPGRGAGPGQPRARGLLGAARRHRRRHRRRLVPHRRRRRPSTTRATSPSPTARRT